MSEKRPRWQEALQPWDEANRQLAANVHPADWRNPKPQARYNLVVLGAGTAGLVAAMGAAGLGARVALVERALLGGDCLNYGCVPSKALLRSARVARDASQTAAYGVEAHDVIVDFPAVMARMRSLRAGISRHDAATRFAAAGADVFLGQAEFSGPDTVRVGGTQLRFARAVIATGARAAVPPIPGLATAGYVTNETVFSLTELPKRLVVIGGGPIGCELAQAFRRLGSNVTVIHRDEKLLAREDEDASRLVEEQFKREGVHLALGAEINRVERRGSERIVTFTTAGREQETACDELLVAAGRTPNVEDLGLDAAGVACGTRGVRVDDHLRTSNHRIFAAGDIAGSYQFTHAADAMARIVIQNALFFGRRRLSDLVVPWTTYTDPEVAHVGLSAAEARTQGEMVRTLTVALSEVDRAILDGETEGFARLHVDAKSGRILGATAVARHAGEMIGEIALAMTEKLHAGALSRTIHPYPTQTEAWKRLGDAWQRTRLTPRVRSLFERFLAWRR